MTLLPYGASIEDVIKELLKDFTLEDILQMSNVTDEEALELLITSGVLDLSDVLSYLGAGEFETDD